MDDAAVVEGANKTTLKLRTRPWRSSLVAMASAASPLRHAHLVRVWVSVRVRVRVRVMGACSGGVAALVWRRARAAPANSPDLVVVGGRVDGFRS